MRAKKSLGQNFLRDDTVIRRIVDALQHKDTDTVIEIGPGRGALTEKLLDTGAKVIAIEIDREFVPALRVQFHFQPNFSVIEADVLDVDFAKVGTDCVSGREVLIEETSLPTESEPPTDAGGSDLKLVGNLPYNISTPILQRLIEQRHLFSRLVLMFQREVVERITAPPGGKERGFLSVLVENAFATEHLFDVPPQAFLPMPKVWSAVVLLTPKPAGIGDEPGFRRLVSLSFAQKRKTILNNLKPVLENASVHLAGSGIDGNRRAETLTLEEWKTLYKNTLTDGIHEKESV